MCGLAPFKFKLKMSIWIMCVVLMWFGYQFFLSTNPEILILFQFGFFVCCICVYVVISIDSIGSVVAGLLKISKYKRYTMHVA